MTKKNKTLLGLLGVAVVGAGVAYLMTTEKGKRVRNSIKDKTQGLVNNLKRNRENNQLTSSDSKTKVGSSHVPAY
jgi:gas vesicle protein